MKSNGARRLQLYFRREITEENRSVTQTFYLNWLGKITLFICWSILVLWAVSNIYERWYNMPVAEATIRPHTNNLSHTTHSTHSRGTLGTQWWCGGVRSVSVDWSHHELQPMSILRLWVWVLLPPPKYWTIMKSKKVNLLILEENKKCEISSADFFFNLCLFQVFTINEILLFHFENFETGTFGFDQ